MPKLPPATRDDLALGRQDKNGRRNGGYLKMLMAGKQWKEKLASGEMTRDDLIVKAYETADRELEKRAEAQNSGANVDALAEDEEYRVEQKARYLADYQWDSTNANDEVGLDHLLDLEVEQRRIKRSLDALRSSANFKERESLWDALREVGKAHAEQQRALGIDRLHRDAAARNADPMDAFREIVFDWAEKRNALLDEWPAVATSLGNEAELRSLAKHHGALGERGYEFLDPLLEAHRRILGFDTEVQRD